MKLYRCTQCGKVESSGSEIEVNRLASCRGGILLPRECHSMDFCSPNCFWSWCNKNGLAQKKDIEIKVREKLEVEGRGLIFVCGKHHNELVDFDWIVGETIQAAIWSEIGHEFLPQGRFMVTEKETNGGSSVGLLVKKL